MDPSYLRPLDDVIARYRAIPRGGATVIPEGRALRWMDDIWLFARRQSPLREAQIAIQAAMRDLDLEMNVGKTLVLTGEEMTSAVFELEHSAVDRALNEDDPDEAPLDELIDEVVRSPETAERTTIRFMTTRMREHGAFDRVGDIADQAARMPHGSDHLARLFRDSEHWKELQEWYVSYAKRWTMRLPWAVSQLGTMFPTSATVDSPLRDLLAETLAASNAPIPLLSVAAQRLSAWSPPDARVLYEMLPLTRATHSPAELSHSPRYTRAR
jgi:hypothetical protein